VPLARDEIEAVFRREHGLMGEHHRSRARAVAGTPSTSGSSKCRQALVAAHVIRICAGVDDEANRFVRQFSNRRDHPVRGLAVARIYQKGAVFAYLHRHVRARAGQQVHVALNRQHLDFALGCADIGFGGLRRHDARKHFARRWWRKDAIIQILFL